MGNNLIIREIKPSDLEVVNSLSSIAFGEGYLKRDDLETYIKDLNKLGLVALMNNQVIAFALAQLLDFKNIATFALNEKEWFIEEFKNSNSIGILKTVVVQPEYKNQGIGTSLTMKRLEFLKRNTPFLLAISWEQNENEANKKVLEKCGLHFKKRIKNYWAEDSIRNNYHCQICGSPPCKCSALVYCQMLQ